MRKRIGIFLTKLHPLFSHILKLFSFVSLSHKLSSTSITKIFKTIFCVNPTICLFILMIATNRWLAISFSIDNRTRRSYRSIEVHFLFVWTIKSQNILRLIMFGTNKWLRVNLNIIRKVIFFLIMYICFEMLWSWIQL